MSINIEVSELINNISDLKIKDQILLSGTIFTARDAAHKRFLELIKNNKPLPFNIKNSIIYYCGPAKANEGEIIGSCGPTTSSRMDFYAPILYSLGVKATIGKGPRSKAVIDAQKKHKAVYLLATGGVGALLSRKVKKADIIAFKDLGPEAVFQLEIVEFPLIVANDVYGNDIFIK